MNTKKDIEAIFPLSPLQGGILFQALYAPGTGVYFEQLVCRLRGDIDREAFAATWQLLIDRHPILRTAFVTKGSKEPVQVVFKRLSLTVRELDWSDRTPDEHAHSLTEYLAHDRSTGFAFNRPPLMRLALIRLAPGAWQFIWSHHHILMDGWSLTLLMQEFLTTYETLAAASEPRFDARLPYGDYLVWLGKQNRREAEGFWRQYLAGFTHPTPLGIDRPGNHSSIDTTGDPARSAGDEATSDTDAAQHEHYFDSFSTDESAAIEAFARAHRLTPSTLFQAAWALLLGLYSGADDVVFGVTLSGRTAPIRGIEQMIGLFINTLPLRARLDGNQPLRAWLAELQSRNMDLQQYEYSDLTDIHGWCAAPRGRQLFESLLVFENYPTLALPPTAGANIQVEQAELVESTHFPLTAVVIPGQSLRLKISFDARRIPPHVGRQVSTHLRSLVVQMLAGEHLSLSTFKLPVAPACATTTPHRAALRPITQTLDERFREAASLHDSRIALSFEGEQWTYGRLALESARLAKYLMRKGVGAETRVGICMDKSPQQIVAMLGVVQAGGCYVPLDPTYPDARLVFMVADSACLFVLTTASLHTRLERLNLAPLSIEEADDDETPVLQATTGTPAVSPDNAAYVIYTSGSTGTPKGVVVTHGNVGRLFRATGEHFQFRSSDVWTLFHSFSFDFSVWEIWGALLHGARLVVVPYMASRDPSAFYRLLIDESVTVLSQTPSAFRQLMGHEQKQSERAPLSLRYVVFGGEALDLQSLRPWFARHGADAPQLINMYGITETTVHVTYRRIVPEDLSVNQGSLIGQPLADLQLHLLDKHGHPVPDGVRGEICIGGDGLARGYLNNSEATAEKFAPNPLSGAAGARLYRSGDFGRRLANGDVEYCGRRDSQVKVRGHRIETGEISAALMRYEGILEAAVRAYDDADGQTRLVAYAVSREGRQPGVEDLRFHLRQHLPDYMLPEHFIFCDAFPLTINGKLDMDALPRPERAREELREQYVAPSGTREEQLARIWENVLGVARVGRHDNFFALGGDSIRSINIMSLAQDKGIVFSLKQLFEQQTIARLAQTLTEEQTHVEGSRAPLAFALVPASDRPKLPADLEDAYPLARLQAGMLFHSDYGDRSGRYHDAFSFRLRLRFDEAKFSRALQTLVDDHPVLRTSFHFADLQQPLQYVHRTVPAPLVTSDLGHLDDEAQNLYLDRWLKQQIDAGFDWERAPLFKLFIHRLRDDTVELSLIWHHAILDGWSAATFLKELSDEYLRLLHPSGTPRASSPPAQTFREFVALEIDALASEDQRRFWRGQLDHLPQTRILRWPQPAREMAQAAERHGGGMVRRHIDPSLSEKVLTFARDAGLPVKSVLLAVHLRVLQALTGDEEVITGLVANGRPATGDSTRVLGLFLNTVPFRLRLPSSSWLALCQAALRAETDILPYRRFSLSEISRLNGNSPPFETSFNFVNFHIYEGLAAQPELQLLGTRSVEQIDIPLSVNFSLGVGDDSLQFGLMYDRAEFSDAQAEALAALYERAISSLAAQPLAPHAASDLLDDDERRRLLFEINDTSRPLRSPLFVHRVVEEQAARTPSAVAVVCAGRQWTYAELDRRASRMARLLLSKGLAPETPVAVLAGRSFDMVCALLAILKAGCAYVPLDADLPPERIAAILQDSGAPLLLAQESLLVRAGQAEEVVEVVVFEACEALLAAFSDDALRWPLHPSQLAYIIFTSGSTGRPKGVAVTHEALANHMQWMQETFPLTPDDVVLQKTSFSFDASVWEFWAPLMAGARLVLARSGGQQDPAYLVAEMQAESITILQVVPSMLEVLIEEPGFARCRTLRRLYVGGEALKTHLSRRFGRALGIPLINLYGPTETTIETSAAVIDETEPGSDAGIGYPIFNTRYYVLDKNLQPVPTGVAGELYIGGICLARGYWHQPELTAERFIPDPFGVEPGGRLYRTGDRVRHLPDARLEYRGRTDRQFKLRGFRIEMADIESALMSLPEIKRCVVVPRQAEHDDQRLVAYYQTSSAAPPPIAEIKQRLRQRLPSYMVPAMFQHVEQWPLLSNGKVDLAALPMPAPLSETSARVVREASTDAERALAGIWRRVLRTERVGIDDNFFDLGGDSILSLQVVAQAREQRLHFTPQELFNHPTIAALARIARSVQATRHEAPAMGDEAPLTPIQHLFFEQDWPNIHHWNQAVLLEVSPFYQAARLRAAIGSTISRHDAFQLRFHHEQGGWRQVYGDPRASFAFDEVELSGLPGSAGQHAYESACHRAQSSLNITNGPLFRAVYFRFDEGGAGRLLLVCHHLIIDGVSWRVFLEDLQASLAGAEDTTLPSLPFGVWARELSRLPLDEIARDEGNFWMHQAMSPSKPLPLDSNGALSANTHESLVVIKDELTQDETRALLAGAASNLKASMVEVLLSCLAGAITGWMGGHELLITLEGHGRESLIADADLSRSIGWFTSVYPLRVELPENAEAPARLAAVKRQMRRVPRGGTGYGLLRYLGVDKDLARRLAANAPPQVSLNYLGQFDNSLDDESPLRYAVESTGDITTPTARRSHALDVVALIVNGRLTLQLIYSRNLHRAATMQALAGNLLKSLREHVEASRLPVSSSWIREDFPLAHLDDAELAGLIDAGASFQDLWPLAPVQEGILFHTLEQETRSGVYVQQLTAAIRGDCDAALLKEAWHLVIGQYANLHAAFVWEGLRLPLQKIGSPSPIPFTLLDWRGFDPDAQQQMLPRLLDEDRAQGFDLRRAPLMRLTLVRLADDAWHLLWTHHHILLDGWSVPLILSQVVDAYRTLRAGHEPRPVSVPPYAGYLAWLQHQNRSEAETFWRNYLAGYDEPWLIAPAPPNTASDTPEESAPLTLAQRESTLTESLSERLRAFAQRRQLTVNNVIQAAWGFVLSRHALTDEVVYGITVSGRPATLAGVEEMVGLFINTLPLRIRVSPQQTIDEWLQSVRDAQSELLRFQGSRLVDIAGWSEVPRGKPLFDTIFVFENYPAAEALQSLAGDFQVEHTASLEQNNYPLTLYVTPARGIKFACSFQPQLIPHLSPRALLLHLQQALSSLLEHESGRVADLLLVSAAERKRILEDWNQTAVAYEREMLLPARFMQAAARSAEKIALVCGSRQMTYGELDERSNRLAHFLREQGVGRESRVAILLERTPEMILALLAVLKAGAAYVPLDPSFPNERLGRIIEEVEPHLLLTSANLSNSLTAAPVPRIHLDEAWAEVMRRKASPLEAGASSQNLAYIIFTSGSSGQPKGVQITHAALVNILDCFQRRPGLDATDVFLAVTTISFDIAALELFLPLLVGATLLLASRETAADGIELARLLDGSGATAMQATPVTWRMLLAAGWKPGEGFRVWCGGELLPRDLAGALLARGVALWNVYGPTETTVWSTMREVRDADESGLIGRPIANTQVYVLDGAGNPLPAGVAGELHIGGDGLTRGYLNLPQLTAEKLIPDRFAPHPGARLYRTGDLARLNHDGELEYLGRLDLQTKVDGFRIELGDVEAALRALPGIRQAAAAVARDEMQSNRLVGYLVYQTSQPAYEVSALREMLAERLPAYMIPSAWVVLESLPLTPNNKLDRKALPAATRRTKPRGGLAPRTPLEEALLEIWREAFQRSDIGVDDSFFELGGHSLIATQIHVKLIKLFQAQLPLRELFRSPTVERLAALISADESVAGRIDKIARAYLKMKRMSPQEREKVLAVGTRAAAEHS